MADNPFGNLIGGDNPPTQAGQDMNKAFIEALMKKQFTPKFEGPGAWMGAAADFGNTIATRSLMQDYNKNQYNMGQNFGNASQALVSGTQQPTGGGGGSPGSGPGGFLANAFNNVKNLFAGGGGGGGGAGAPGAGTVGGAPGVANPRAPGGGGDYYSRVAQIESSNNPNSNRNNPYTQYKGLYQFGTRPGPNGEPSEWDKWGNGADVYDGNAQLDAFKRKDAFERQELSQRLGRPITDNEAYLAHQQGVTGAYTILTNPDAPLRQSYAQAGIPFNHITNNLPKSFDPNTVTGRQIANYWGGRFPTNQPQMPSPAEDEAANATGAAPGETIARPNTRALSIDQATGTTGKMNLGAGGGGPGAVDATEKGLVENAQANQPNQFSRPAGPGENKLSLPRLESPQELNNYITQFLVNGGSPQQAQEIIKNFRERSEQRLIQTPGGPVPLTPQAGGAAPVQGQPMPELAKEWPKISIKGMEFQLDPRSGHYVPVTPGAASVPGTTVVGGPSATPGAGGAPPPGGGGGAGGAGGATPGAGGGVPGYEGLEAPLEFSRQQDIQDEAAKANQKTVDEFKEEGRKSNTALRALYQMQAINQMPRESGPTAEWMRNARAFLSNFTPQDLDDAGMTDWSKLSATEAYKKFNQFLAAEATKAVSSRGTNFVLRSFQDTFPNLTTSKEGASMLTDLLIQEYETKRDLGTAASQWSPQDILHNLNQKVNDFYGAHAATIHTTKGDIATKRYTKEDIESGVPDKDLGPGKGFILPNGRLGRTHEIAPPGVTP